MRINQVSGDILANIDEIHVDLEESVSIFAAATTEAMSGIEATKTRSTATSKECMEYT